MKYYQIIETGEMVIVSNTVITEGTCMYYSRIHCKFVYSQLSKELEKAYGMLFSGLISIYLLKGPI